MHFFSVQLTDPEPTEVLVVELVRGYSFEETLEHIYKTEPKRLANVQMVIARAPVFSPIAPAHVEKLRSGKLRRLPPELEFLGHGFRNLATAFARFPRRPIHLLFSYKYTHYISRNLNPTSKTNPLDGVEGDVLATTLRTIQRKEIETIVEDGRARLPSMPGVLYEAPNGHLVRSFLRIGNIQRSRSAVDSLFFWLLPHLRDCSAIITDTWSIGSIALNASRRLASYSKPIKRPCAVEMVSSYLDDSQERASEAADHIARLIRITEAARPRSILHASKVLFLMSAISTGGFYNRVCALLDQREKILDKVRFVSLFNLGINPSPIPCLVDWSTYAGYGTYAPVNREDLQGRIDTITIDQQTYFPTSYKDVVHGVRQNEIKEIREFLDRYADISPFKVHRTVTDDGPARHHGISIDTLALANHPIFQKRLTDKLIKLDPPPALVITPIHETAKSLAATAITTLRERNPAVKHLMHPDLVFTDNSVTENKALLSMINEIDERSSILVLDDAFITGRRLNHYQMALRHLSFRGRVHYLVGVARPTAMSGWEYRCSMLKSRASGAPFASEGNSVELIEKFTLPDWNEDECPWCAELRILRKIFRSRHQA